MSQEQTGQDTQILWEEEPEHLEELYQKKLEQYAALKGERYAHRREQLYLMLMQGCSEELIRTYFETYVGTSSRDVDFIRAVALIAGEDAAKQLSGKEIPFEEAKEMVRECLLQDQLKDFPALQTLLKEKEKNAYRFEVEMEFLIRERKMAAGYYEKLMEKEQETGKAREEQLLAEKKNLEEHFQEEIRKLEEKLQFERTAAQRQIQAAKQEKSAAMTYAQMENNALPLPDGDGFFAFLRWKRRCREETVKEQQRREEYERAEKERRAKENFIMKILRNKDFSAQQLEVLLRLAQLPVSVSEMEEIAEPDVPLRNMELFELHLKERSGKDV